MQGGGSNIKANWTNHRGEGGGQAATKLLGQDKLDTGAILLATTGAVSHPMNSDATRDADNLCGVLRRLELLEEAHDVWKDTVQTGVTRHKELASEVYQLQADLDAWQHDDPEEQLDVIGQDMDSLQAKLMDAGFASVADTLEIVEQEISPVLSRIQGLEAHAQASMVKFDQRLLALEANSGVGEGRDAVQGELKEVQQKTQSLWETICGSAVIKGKDLVLYGLVQASLNGCRGTVVEWEEHRDRWTVRINGKNLLVKTGNLLAGDGLMAKWTFVEQGLLQSD